ncbi:hypothetical protein GGU10DRAFT_337628, partial [Lentinula aff. detonsa]
RTTPMTVAPLVQTVMSSLFMAMSRLVELTVHSDQLTVYNITPLIKTVSTCLSTVHKDPKYFCDPAAYGRHCGYSRNIHQAIAYWNAVNKSEYNGWLLAPDSFPNRSGNLLLSVVRLLSGKEFPGMGKLSAFQVAVDYMKAGALVATQREFVETLIFVNAGAIKRLTEWEYLSSKVGSPKRDLEEVESAFAKVMQDLKQRWDQKRGTRGRGIDMIDVEHWLCKASRKRLGRSSYNAIYK